jgi:hypothetical protein
MAFSRDFPGAICFRWRFLLKDFTFGEEKQVGRLLA